MTDKHKQQRLLARATGDILYAAAAREMAADAELEINIKRREQALRAKREAIQAEKALLADKIRRQKAKLLEAKLLEAKLKAKSEAKHEARIRAARAFAEDASLISATYDITIDGYCCNVTIYRKSK